MQRRSLTAGLSARFSFPEWRALTLVNFVSDQEGESFTAEMESSPEQEGQLLQFVN